MTDRCQYCRELFLSDLVALAREEFSGHCFPQEAFYQHHESIEDLEQAAKDGCDLCQLILDCFKGTPSTGDWTWPTEWLGTNADIDRSMFDEATDLVHTSVRIGLNAENTYAAESLDAVKAFDTLLVQVGPGEDTFEDEGTDDYLMIPMLYLRIKANREVPITVDGFNVGRFDVDPKLDSDTNFTIARSWLKQCQSLHSNCLLTKETTLPSRVIDVGRRNSSEKPRLVISNGMTGQYAALSHCWGGRIAPLLTTESLPQFMDEIPLLELPLNFQHAIEITRQLGLRYVWIDSLCLVQNSKKDWQAESKHMGLYYFNSTITISAMVSRRSSDGIFNQNEDPPPAPKSARLQVSPGSSLTVEIQMKETGEETLRSLDLKSPLSSRGWTLQESLLSPRNLFFGRRQIYWECCEGFEAADGAQAWNPFPETNRHLHAVLLKHESEKEELKRQGILQKYYDWVQAFSHRKLSVGVDKLPAFSGLAQRLQPYIGGDYLAGIWRSDFQRGLLWYAEMGYCKHVNYYRAPSWSWAVTDDPVTWPHQPPQGLPISQRGLDLVEARITSQDDSNPFGIIENAMLVVEGSVCPLVRSLQIVNMRTSQKDLRWFGTSNFDEAYEQEEDKAYIGLVFEASVYGQKHLVSISAQYEAESSAFELDKSKFAQTAYLALLVNADEKDDAEARSVCLILEAVDEEPELRTYRRVGFMDLVGVDMGWLDAWSKQRINLV